MKAVMFLVTGVTVVSLLAGCNSTSSPSTYGPAGRVGYGAEEGACPTCPGRAPVQGDREMIPGCGSALDRDCYWYIYTSSTVAPAELTPQQAKQASSASSKVLVVDVRGQEDYAASHVPGAINVPLDSVQSRFDNGATSRTTPIICVCAQGKRGQQAAWQLQRMGYTSAAYVGGGMSAWKQANLPTTGA